MVSTAPVVLPTRTLIRSRPTVVAASAVGLFATAVSTIGSWIPSLWGDEAASVLSAKRPLGSLFEMLLHVDAVHGLSYVVLHFWVRMFGTSPFAVRFPSAVAIGLCAAGVVWLCARCGSLRFAVLAGAIAAIVPRLTYAGTEARAYAWDAALATALCIVIVEIMRRRRPSRWWWAAYAAVLALGIWTFLYLALLTVAVGAALAVTAAGRARLRPWAIASAAAFLAASPVIVLGFLERAQISFLAHRAVMTPDAILVSMWWGALPVAVLAWTLILVTAVGWALDLRESLRTGRDAPWLPTLALAWLVVPVGILLLASLVSPGYTARYGTFATPAGAILIALGLRRLARAGRRFGMRLPWAAIVASVLLVATIAPVWASQRTPYAKNDSDWNDIAAVVRAHAQPGDAIVFDEGVRPSRRTRLALGTDPAAFSAVRDVTLHVPYSAGTTWHDTAYTVAEAVARGRFDGVERVWTVEYASGGNVDSWGVTDLRALGFRPVREIALHRSVVTLYER